MAGQIRMSPERMGQRAGEVRVQEEAFVAVVGKMQAIINELQAEWEGQASQQFAAQFDALKPSFENMRNLLHDISLQLDNSAAAIEQLDRDIAGKFGV